MSELVIFYKHCWDGFCAAWLLYEIYPNATFVPASYGDAPPAIIGDVDVYIVDFSYPRDVLTEIVRQARNVVVLDHHATAQDALDGFANDCVLAGFTRPLVVFDMNKSGARLTWEHLRLMCSVVGDPPWLVDYTEDRDLWRFKLAWSKPVNALVRSYPLNFDVWDGLALLRPVSTDGAPTPVVYEGQAILRREQQIIDDHVAHAYTATLAGHKCKAVNATTLFSDIAGELARGMPFGVAWFENGAGLRQYSLRSDENGLDVSKVAQQFGGGGHKHAAGFSLRMRDGVDTDVLVRVR